MVAQILPSASGTSLLGKKVRSTRHTSFLCDELTVWRVDWLPVNSSQTVRSTPHTIFRCDELTCSRASWQSSYEPNSILFLIFRWCWIRRTNGINNSSCLIWFGFAILIHSTVPATTRALYERAIRLYNPVTTPVENVTCIATILQPCYTAV